MSMTLTEILDLTGKLDDTPGEDTARARFCRHLAREMSEPGRIRDFVEECLRNAGDQYNRAPLLFLLPKTLNLRTVNTMIKSFTTSSIN